MKKRLTDNLVIKIVSFFLAILLWFFIQIVQNPDMDYTFSSMPIKLINESVMESNGYVIPEDFEQYADITVKSTRWKLNEIDKDNFFAYIDLSEVNATGIKEFPVKIRLNNESIVVSNKHPNYVTVFIDKIVTVQKPVKINLTGDLKDNLITDIKHIVLDSNSITVTAPKTYADKIENAVIEINLNNKSEDFKSDYKVRLADKDGEIINNRHITVSKETINAAVSVMAKKIVPVTLVSSSENITLSAKPAMIEIEGPKAIIDNINEIKIEGVHFANPSVGAAKTIELTLPNGVSAIEKSVTATVTHTNE